MIVDSLRWRVVDDYHLRVAPRPLRPFNHVAIHAFAYAWVLVLGPGLPLHRLQVLLRAIKQQEPRVIRPRLDSVLKDRELPGERDKRVGTARADLRVTH